MWSQISAIVWAQFRVTRNHLPRTKLGNVFSWLLSGLWYALFAFLAGLLALKLPELPASEVARWLPVLLLGVFLFWQVVTLFTLSSGWSLDLKKLQIYPIETRALFSIEVLLRLTAAPEMVIVVTGAIVGLMRCAWVPAVWPLALILFVPLNLFLQLGVRDLVLHAFERNRFRELFAILVVSIGILPQLLIRTPLGKALKPYFLSVSHSMFAPWQEAASLSLGRPDGTPALLLLAWTALAFVLARRMFAASLKAEEVPRSGSAVTKPLSPPRFAFSSWPGKVFRDPVAALMEKEMQSLVRMPRFRVLFGMACVLGILVFIPATMNEHDDGASFVRQNLIPVVNLYGLLILSDALLLNAFGLDRSAAQVYFVSPLSLGEVIKAKNLTAVTFVVLQSAVILLVAAFLHGSVTAQSIVSGILASAVVTIFLLAAGNYTSLAMARPIDPKQTFKKQAGAKMQLWLLGCSLALFILVGFAFLARYALQSDTVFYVVLLFEFGVGLLVYRFGLESAIKRGLQNRESLVAALSKSSSPISAG